MLAIKPPKLLCGSGDFVSVSKLGVSLPHVLVRLAGDEPAICLNEFPLRDKGNVAGTHAIRGNNRAKGISQMSGDELRIPQLFGHVLYPVQIPHRIV